MYPPFFFLSIFPTFPPSYFVVSSSQNELIFYPSFFVVVVYFLSHYVTLHCTCMYVYMDVFVVRKCKYRNCKDSAADETAVQLPSLERATASQPPSPFSRRDGTHKEMTPNYCKLDSGTFPSFTTRHLLCSDREVVTVNAIVRLFRCCWPAIVAGIDDRRNRRTWKCYTAFFQKLNFHLVFLSFDSSIWIV